MRNFPERIGGYDVSMVIDWIVGGRALGEVADECRISVDTLKNYVTSFRAAGMLGDSAVVNIAPDGRCVNPRCRRKIRWAVRLCFDCDARRRNR